MNYDPPNTLLLCDRWCFSAVASQIDKSLTLCDGRTHHAANPNADPVPLENGETMDQLFKDLSVGTHFHVGNTYYCKIPTVDISVPPGNWSNVNMRYVNAFDTLTGKFFYFHLQETVQVN